MPEDSPIDWWTGPCTVHQQNLNATSGIGPYTEYSYPALFLFPAFSACIKQVRKHMKYLIQRKSSSHRAKRLPRGSDCANAGQMNYLSSRTQGRGSRTMAGKKKLVFCHVMKVFEI